MIKKYRCNPLPVHASQWDGANITDMNKLVYGTGYVCSIMRAGNVATLILSNGPTVRVLRAMLGCYLIRHNDLSLEILTEKQFDEKYTQITLKNQDKK